MESRKEQAAELKRRGSHNCAQAVLCTYHVYTGIDEETIKHVGNSFAAGMGNMEGTCGALVGAGMAYGLATKDKAKSMRGMRQMMEKFKQRNGATQCRMLKGVGTGKVLRECPLCVADAAEFLEEQLLGLSALGNDRDNRWSLPYSEPLVSPSSIHVSLSTGSGTLPYAKSCEAKAMVRRYLLR